MYSGLFAFQNMIYLETVLPKATRLGALDGAPLPPCMCVAPLPLARAAALTPLELGIPLPDGCNCNG